MKIEELEDKIKSEYEKVRSVEEFLTWTNNLLPEKMKSYEAFNRHRVVKKILQEILPIKTFLAKYPEKFSTVQVLSGNQSYDGIGWNNKIATFIEVTTVKDGALHFLQAKHLDMFGIAPASGIRAEDLKIAIKNKVALEGEAIDSGLERIKVFNDTCKAILEKNKIDYPENTILIACVDCPTFTDKEAWEKFCTLFNSPIDSRFEEIYIIDLNGDKCFKVN